MEFYLHLGQRLVYLTGGATDCFVFTKHVPKPEMLDNPASHPCRGNTFPSESNRLMQRPSFFTQVDSAVPSTRTQKEMKEKHVHTHLHRSMHTSDEQIRQCVLSVQHNVQNSFCNVRDHFIGEKSTLLFFLLQKLFKFFTTPSPTISVLGPVISYHCSPLLLDLVSYLSLLFFVYHCWS